MKSSIEILYNKQYKDIGFERSGLFDLINNEFQCKTVLYPGSSIHITPSFYFDHVSYVDNNQLAIDFFRQKEQVGTLIKKNRVHIKSSYFEFLPKDFTEDLDLRENSYDLLISIFSGKQIDYCKKYVQKNGIILTSSFFSDNESIQLNESYELLCTIICRNGKYIKHPTIIQKEKSKRSKLNRTSRGFQYKDNETYYIYHNKV